MTVERVGFYLHCCQIVVCLFVCYPKSVKTSPAMFPCIYIASFPTRTHALTHHHHQTQTTAGSTQTRINRSTRNPLSPQRRNRHHVPPQNPSIPQGKQDRRPLHPRNNRGSLPPHNARTQTNPRYCRGGSQGFHSNHGGEWSD